LLAVEAQNHGIPQLEDTTMLSLALARALLPVSLGAASVGLLVGAPELFNHDQPLRTPSSAGSYEAELAGDVTGTLRGAVDHGGPATEARPQPYVITLGAYSGDGALVFSRWNSAQPSAGSYPITPEPTEDGITALVVTGSPTRPGGAFRADRGTLTITHASPSGLAGEFELHARGFGVADPDRDDREVTVRGSFTTSPSQAAAVVE
jgi:hypothetical protein